MRPWRITGGLGPHWLCQIRARLSSRSRSTERLPYPVEVRRRDYAAEAPPPGGGVEAFDTPEALAINRARLEHLASLELPLEGKRVLDVGCGVGHLAQFFLGRGCQVTCVDGRPENIDSLRARYPGLEAYVLDVEQEPLSRLGSFPVVFSYGLLYHLDNPVLGLRNMASICGELLLLETLVCDQAKPVLRLVDESKTANQALRGFGSRPSPSFVVVVLNRVGFKYVYAPSYPPDHRDFQFCWSDNLDVSRDGHPMRCIFVASRRRMETPHLVSLLDG